MAHRIYIYNIQEATGEQFPHVLGEWNYEIPLLMLPLFSGNLKAKGKVLYASRLEGISMLRRFYDLLGTSYHLTYKKVFTEPVHQLFEFLENLPYDTLMIDGWDVFNMNEEKHSVQAKEWVVTIKKQLKIFEKSLFKVDLAPMNDTLKSVGYTSFLEALQTDWIHYGLGYWNEEAYKYGFSEVFEENGFQGLKDAQQNIIAPAIYQEIYAFNQGFAMFKRDDLFGFINTKGQEIFPPTFDAAFDSFQIYSIETTNDEELLNEDVAYVEKDNKRGLIHLNNAKIVIPIIYDDVAHLLHQFFNVKNNEEYQIVNKNNEIVLEDKSNHPFEFEYYNIFYTKISGSSKRKYYTSSGTFLGEFVEQSLETLPNHYFYAKANKFQKKISIINPQGQVLIDEIDQIIVTDENDTFAYLKDKKWFFFHTINHQTIPSDLEFLSISTKYLPHYLKDVYIIKTNKGNGIYDAMNESWKLQPSLDYTKISPIENEFFAVETKQGMHFWNEKTNVLSEVYDHISEPIDNEKQSLILYKKDELFCLTIQGDIQKIEAAELGKLNHLKYNLRGKHLSYFNQFFDNWTKHYGANYYQVFDIQTLYNYYLELQRSGKEEGIVEILEFGATQNHSDMMTELGILLANNENEELYNPERAVNLYQKAAKQNNKYAWNNLGYHLQNGLGCEQNIEKALEAYKKAGELGNGMGWENVADLYYFGVQIDQNYDEALLYYKKAEKLFHFNDDKLAEIYYAKEDFGKLISILKKDKQETFAPFYYGILYEFGLGGLKVNIKKAINYFEKAMIIASYEYPMKQLLWYYREESEYADDDKFQEWLYYAEENEIEIDRKILGLETDEKKSILHRIFKGKK